MQQFLGPRILTVLSLIAIDTSVFVILFYRPADLLPRSYDLLKLCAALFGIIGIIIFSDLFPVIICIGLFFAYPIAFKLCFRDIPDSFPRDTAAIVVIEGVLFSIGGIILSLTIGARFPLGAAVAVLLLAGYFSFRLRSFYKRAQAIKDADKDAERKKNHISSLVKLASPLSALLSRYHPDWYPPPINRIMATSLAKYATVIRDLEKAYGKPYNDTPDYELIRSGLSKHPIPETWNSEKTINFFHPILDAADALKLCAELPLDVLAKYEAELQEYFDSSTDDEQQADDRLPPEVRKQIIQIFAESFEEEIARTDARLTALIPDYIASFKTVIGTPPDDVPIAYDSLESRYRHTFLIGSSGAGKSTVITNLVVQDMRKGHGVIVMSPDQKLLRDLVPYIPEHRLDDVIYFDPNDTTPPIIGFNPFYFEPPENLNPNSKEYRQIKDNKAQETYAVLERTLQINTEPTQRLLNNAMYALTGRPNTTFSDLSRLIDPKERAFHVEIANDSRVDNETRKFWRNYATESANTMVYRNLSDRIMPLLRSSLFDIFRTQSLSFHRELNERARIFLIDLSTFGSRTSREARIAAQLLIPTIQQTIFRRNNMEESDYIPYFMYIDEFQHFADTNEESIGDMAEQIRKFHFGLILTSLAASDLSTKLFDTIIGVMRTKICLTISAKDARLFASEMLIKRDGRDSYNPEVLQTLGIGEAYVKTPPHNAAVFVKMPREPLGNVPKVSISFEQLKHRSKTNFGAMENPSESATVDQDTQHEQVAEAPDTPPASESQAQNEQPKKAPPRPTKRKRRNRFDDDAGEPEIEVS